MATETARVLEDARVRLIEATKQDYDAYWEAYARARQATTDPMTTIGEVQARAYHDASYLAVQRGATDCHKAYIVAYKAVHGHKAGFHEAV